MHEYVHERVDGEHAGTVLRGAVVISMAWGDPSHCVDMKASKPRFKAVALVTPTSSHFVHGRFLQLGPTINASVVAVR